MNTINKESLASIIFIFLLSLSSIVAQNNNFVETFDENIESPILYPDIIRQEKKEFLHFKWRTDIANYEKVIMANKFMDGYKILAEIKYPQNKLDITNLKDNHDTVYLIAVDNNGCKSLPISIETIVPQEDLFPLMDRIKIKKSSKGAYFTQGQKKFTPKGVNYVGLLLNDHATFEPNHPDGIIHGYYDPMTTESVFRLLKKKGYNLIRVFLKTGDRNPQIWGMSGNPATYSSELWEPYMENVIDFIRCARKYGIYVMPTFTDNERMANKYWSQPNKFDKTTYQEILFSEDAINAKKEYIIKFLNSIVQQPDGEELSKILFGITMQNEFHFDCNRPPFSPSPYEGYEFKYTFRGYDYDMSIDTQRRKLALTAADNYYKEMKEAVKSVIPDLLIGEGTFTLAAVGKDVDNSIGVFPIKDQTDTRFPLNGLEYLRTDIDFLDLHIYKWGVPGDGVAAFLHAVSNMLLDTQEAKNIMKRKPIILGEFGSFKQDHPTLNEAEQYVISLRNAAMENGFRGWCFWTLDCFEQQELWNLMHNNGQILDTLIK